MMPMTTRSNLPIIVPDPDDIRIAIDMADERARLLRRLLRLALRLHLHLTTANRLPVIIAQPKGGQPNG